MPDDEENKYSPEAGYVSVSDIPDYEGDTGTPAPTPLVRPPVYETPAPTPAGDYSVDVGSGAPTPFVPRDHPPIDDETASKFFGELKRVVPGTDPLHEQMLIRELRKYGAALGERDKRAQDQYVNNIFTTDEGMAKLTDNPAMRERERLSPMPNLVRYEAANWAWLENYTGTKITSQLQYEKARDDYSREHDGKPKANDTDFFNNRKKEFEVGNEAEQAQVQAMGKALTETADALATQRTPNLTKVLDEVKAAHPDLAEGPYAERFAEAIRSSSVLLLQKSEKFQPQLAVVLPIIGKFANQTATEEDGLLFARTLASMGRSNAMELIGLAEMALNANGDKVKKDAAVQTLDNIEKAIIHGFGFVPELGLMNQEDQIEEAQRGLGEGRARMLPDGRVTYPREQLPGAPPPPGRELTYDETAKENEKLKMAQQVIDSTRLMTDALYKKLDPIKYIGKEGTFWGGVEKYGLVAIDSAPLMGVSAVSSVLGTLVGGPVGGALAAAVTMTVATRAQEYHDLSINNPELSRDTRKVAANWSAIAQLPLNYLELELFKGAFPALGAIFKDLKTGQVLQAIGKFTGRQITEWTAETIQNGISDLTQEIAKQAKRDIPEAMYPVWDNAVAQGPMVFFATLPYTLIGSGMASLNEYGVYKKELVARDALATAGLSEADIANVLAQPTWETKNAALQEALRNRTPEAIAAAATKYEKDFTAAQAGMEKWQSLPDIPAFSQRKLDDGTIEYVIKSADGTELTTTTNLQEAKIAFEQHVGEAVHAHQLAQAEAAASDEAIAETAKSELTQALLPLEERTAAPAETEATQPEAPAKTVVVEVFDRDLNGFTTAELKPTPQLLQEIHQEAKVYEKLISCLG